MIVVSGVSFDVYNLARLCIPLIEISTYPDIVDKCHVKEVAESLGSLLRSTKSVIRGLGSIRQDVNVSFNGGYRVEIKGVQDLKGLEKVVEFEVERQKSLLKIKKSLDGKKFGVSKVFDLSGLLKNSGFKLFDGGVFGVKFDCLKGFFGLEVQKGRRFGTELSDCAKVACGVKGIIHSDEILNYVDESFVGLIVKKLKVCENDGFVLICGSEEVAGVALDVVSDRVKVVFDDGFLREVRKANGDYSSSFMRSISGSDRMYPETDSVSFRPDVSVSVPRLNSEVIESYISRGLNKDLAEAVVRRDLDVLIDGVMKKVSGLKLGFVAESLLNFFKLCDKGKFDFFSLKFDFFVGVFSDLSEGKFSKDGVLSIFSDVLSKGEFRDFSDYYFLDDKDVKREVSRILKSFKGDSRKGFGVVMSELRGRADSGKVSKFVDDFFKKNKKV